MDGQTLAAAIAYIKSIPDGAAASAAAAEEAADRAEEIAESIETATVEEAKVYLGIN